MCGIAGAVGERVPDVSLLHDMAHAMQQRGPDGEGSWTRDQVGFAFRRLAILDLHERANQPMHFGRWHIVFNGEIYNYRELRETLTGRGHAFRTSGDTEVLLHAWAEWGQEALDRLNGMFAFAVWDDEQRSLTLASDPFGEKPVFYWSDPEQLVFASDLRALLAHPAVPCNPDESTLAAYLARGGARPEQSRTFLAGVRRLPAAHVLVWRERRFEVARYWHPQPVSVPRDYRTAVDAYRELLRDSVRLRLRSDVPVGTSLSGGLDSSAVVALVAACSDEADRHAFTARFPGYVNDEWRYAEAVGKRAGVTRHHVVEPSASGLLNDLDRFLDDHQEPVGSCSIYAQWCVMRAAREAGITVLLDGQGNDELLGGYGEAPGFALRGAGLRVLASAVRRDPGELDSIGRSLIRDYAPTPAMRLLVRRAASPYVAADRIAAGAAAIVPRPPLAEPARGFRRYLLRQTFDVSLPILVLFADRSSMAHSREVRLPFLDRRVAEFSLSLPVPFAYQGGYSKRVLRDAMAGMIPESVLGRTDKVGFEPPQEAWLNEPAMRDAIADVLLDPTARSRALYDQRTLEADLGSGRWRDHHGIWRAFNAELWLRAMEGRRAFRREVAGANGGPPGARSRSLRD